MKLFAQFFVGFFGIILLLNAIVWLFGQAVAAVVAWVIAVCSLVVVVICMTVGGYEAPAMTKKQAERMRDHLRTTGSA